MKEIFEKIQNAKELWVPIISIKTTYKAKEKYNNNSNNLSMKKYKRSINDNLWKIEFRNILWL